MNSIDKIVKSQNLPKGPPESKNSRSRKSASHHISSLSKIIRMISWDSSFKISQHSKVDVQSRKSSKINPPSQSEASFRSKTTDLNVSDVLNLMKAMISKHLLSFFDNFQMFIFQPPKIEILLWKIVSGTERICAQCHRKYETKPY